MQLHVLHTAAPLHHWWTTALLGMVGVEALGGAYGAEAVDEVEYIESLQQIGSSIRSGSGGRLRASRSHSNAR